MNWPHNPPGPITRHMLKSLNNCAGPVWTSVEASCVLDCSSRDAENLLMSMARKGYLNQKRHRQDNLWWLNTEPDSASELEIYG